MINAQSLSSCRITEDGMHFRLRFLDGDGSEQVLEISLECMRQLSSTLQNAERRGRHPKQGPRTCHPVAAWTAEPAADSKGVILTFVTPDDDMPIAFRIDESGLVSLAEAVVEHELAAYPDGLRFT